MVTIISFVIPSFFCRSSILPWWHLLWPPPCIPTGAREGGWEMWEHQTVPPYRSPIDVQEIYTYILYVHLHIYIIYIYIDRCICYTYKFTGMYVFSCLPVSFRPVRARYNPNLVTMVDALMEAPMMMLEVPKAGDADETCPGKITFVPGLFIARW